MPPINPIPALLSNVHQRLLDRVATVDKHISGIKEFYIRCILSLNSVWVGYKEYQIQNVKIYRVKPSQFQKN
jgi:hypothetical protein